MKEPNTIQPRPIRPHVPGSTKVGKPRTGCPSAKDDCGGEGDVNNCGSEPGADVR